jgi:hypothetical protein
VFGRGSWGQNDSLLLVGIFIFQCDRCEEVVTNIELFVYAVEKCFAERATLEIGDQSTEKLDTGGHVLVIGTGERLIGENAKTALECVDAIHVEEGQAFLAENDFILEDGLLHEIFICLSLVLASG